MSIGYFVAIGISIIFMMYLDGGIGVMMLSFLLLMPVISLILTLIVRKKLHVSFLLPESAAKQQPVSVKILLEKDTPFPLPFLRMQLIADAHFLPLNPNAEELPQEPERSDTDAGMRRAYRKWQRLRQTQLCKDMLPLCLSMGTAREAVYEIAVTPHFCGTGDLSLERIVLSDYLGMFRFRLDEDVKARLMVSPFIPEMHANTDIFRSVSTAVAAADEENESTPVFSASSAPGYEHRDYIPGDSLKRINWKLSSKRRQLMVRKDEPVSLSRLAVVLDFRRSKQRMQPETYFSMEEQLIETALGFLMLCTKNGYPCNLCYADKLGSWSTLALDDAEQLSVEAVSLLQGGFRPKDELSGLPVLPPALTQDAGAVLLYFTAEPDAAAAAALESLQTQVYLIVPEKLIELRRDITVPKNGSLWRTTAEHKLEAAD